MRKLKKSQYTKKHQKTDNNQNQTKSNSDTSTSRHHQIGKQRSTKGENYRTRHKYVQDYLDIPGAAKRKKKDPAEKAKRSKRVTQTKDKPIDARGTKEINEDGTKTNKQDDYFIDKSENTRVLSKALRKKLHYKEVKKRKKEKILEKQNEKNLGFNQFRDDVQFGEVVSAPPRISAKPRGSNSSTNKPGERALLLKNMPTTPADSNITNVVRNSHKMKRKNLSLGARRILDTEQQRVVELYRQLKKKN